MYMCAVVTESSCIVQAQVDSCHEVAVAASNRTGSGNNWHFILQHYHHPRCCFLRHAVKVCGRGIWRKIAVVPGWRL